MKKSFRIIGIFILLILIIAAILQIVKNNSTNIVIDPTIANTDDFEEVEDKEYVLSNNTYIIGQDIPPRSYTVKGISDDISILVISAAGKDEVLVEVGDELDLTNAQVIEVDGGTITLE